MASIGEVSVQVVPDIDGAAFRDAAVLVAGVQLHDAIYHSGADFVASMPKAVARAYGDLQGAIRRLKTEGSTVEPPPRPKDGP